MSFSDPEGTGGGSGGGARGAGGGSAAATGPLGVRGWSAGIGPGGRIRPAIASASSRRMESSDPSTTVRLSRFSSSRTLPGHSYSENSRSVSLASAIGGLL